jgi:hypothetical protein
MHIATNIGCPICSSGCEDVMHTLFTCLHAKQVWEKLRISEVINEATALDRTGAITIALEHILSVLKEDGGL